MLRNEHRPTRSYTGIGPIAIALATYNLARKERRRDEHVPDYPLVEVIGTHPQQSTVEVFTLSTGKKRVVVLDL